MKYLNDYSGLVISGDEKYSGTGTSFGSGKDLKIEHFGATCKATAVDEKSKNVLSKKLKGSTLSE